MYFTNIDMNNNRIKAAKFKLSKHRTMGEETTLSIFQVARLMDTVSGKNAGAQPGNSPIFFSLN